MDKNNGEKNCKNLNLNSVLKYELFLRFFDFPKLYYCFSIKFSPW